MIYNIFMDVYTVHGDLNTNESRIIFGACLKEILGQEVLYLFDEDGWEIIGFKLIGESPA